LENDKDLLIEKRVSWKREEGLKRVMIDFTHYIAEHTGGFTGRTWVFQAIHTWLTRLDGSRYFLLTGEPGCGKTALAARLSQFSRGEAVPPEGCAGFTHGFLSALHFCSARDSFMVDSHTFVCSLAQQLRAKYPAEYAAPVKDVADRPSNVSGQAYVVTAHDGSKVAGMYVEHLHVETLVLSGLTPQEAFNQRIRNPLENLYNSGFDKPITILVDSLDETLSREHGVTIAHLLSRLEQLPPQVRFILTSRPDRRVENEFRDAEHLCLSDPIFKEQNWQDVPDSIGFRGS
jgi:hypothetical protein